MERASVNLDGSLGSWQTMSQMNEGHAAGAMVTIDGFLYVGSAAIANVRRIQRYLQAIFQEELRQNKVQDFRDSASDALAPSFLVSARTIFARFLRFRSVFGRGFIV